MTKTQNKAGAIRIHEERDAQRHVLLHPENDDVFIRTGQQVIAACRLGISFELWIAELKDMLENVRDWATRNKERVRSCHCSPRGSKVVFFICPATPSFDFDLADDLVALHSVLRSRFNVGTIELHQIPWNEADRFLTLDNARLIYGDEVQEPPQSVAT